MLFRKRKTSDDIRPLRGSAKLFHRLGRLILFPLRRPVITILILLVMFLAPTFRGVKPVNVHKWYASQISALYNKALIWWGTRQPEVSPGEFKFNPEEAAPAPVAPSEYKVPEPVDENAPNILDVLRGGAETSPEQEEPQVPEVPEVEQPIPSVVPVPVEEPKEPTVNIPVPEKEIRIPKNESLYIYPKEKKVYALKYLDYPHEVEGRAIVHDCNEIEINGEFIMMYGVYVHPYTAQGTKATQYLKNLIENKTVTCGIVAYTNQNIATGICYYNGTNLNRSMVVKGYTKNVAL